jgi:hypothetical protein
MDLRNERLTDAELHTLFDRLFPDGFAGADVRAEVAPTGWEQSPLVACFHPSVERVFEERLQFHQNVAALRIAGSRRTGRAQVETEASPAPTLEEVQREYEPKPVHADAELIELVGLCLWDVFSDNHDVMTADGRVADIGSFRGAGAFLDEYLTGNRDGWREGDYLRFYLGTIGISARADLAPVYAMIFRRMRALGGDWVYHFPELGLVDLGGLRPDSESLAGYSPNEALAAQRNAQEREAEVARLRADLGEINTRAREDAMDRLPPATVRAYRQVYGRDPKGWPPV